MMKYVLIFSWGLLLCMTTSAQTLKPKVAQKWVKSKVWSNGWNIAADKSVNAVEFANQYAKNKELWDDMFRFLAENDLNTLPLGNHIISKDRCWATVSEYTPKSIEKGNIESHKKFIDLQYVLRGNEKMGIAKRAHVKKEYNPNRDVAFWTSDHITYFPATNTSFFLFFPGDIHQPSVQTDGDTLQSRKIVIKIEYVN